MFAVLEGPARRRLTAAAGAVLAAAAVVATGLVVSAAPAAADTTDAAIPAGRYYAVDPTRVLDTRAQHKPWHSAEARVVDLSNALPATASAVVINLTVTNPTNSGYLTAYPAGAALPNASSLNFKQWETRANSVTVAVGTASMANQIAVFGWINGGGTADVLVDVTGYYGSGGAGNGAGTAYYPLPSPVRLFDTRSSIGALSNVAPKNTGIVTVDYGSPAANKAISAVLMNLTVTSPAGPGNLTVWDGTGPVPNVSSVNFVPGQTVANVVIAPVVCADTACSKLTFSIRNNNSPSTQVIGDIAGAYMTPGQGGLVYTPMTPQRITDTRQTMPFRRLGIGGSGTTTIDSLPANTRAVNLNFTAVLPSAPTFLSVYPTGVAVPGVSNINVVAGDIAANAAQVRVVKGQFTTYNNAGSSDVVIDLQGVFTLDPAFSS